ncbi:Zn-finger in ubiquitin-hydrolases and other protein [Glomus cerebriforme]|uniref:Zn-finger in ubiquitin-hydrolases and other protein n=1 Tax=Glomus cerebriforme TaxID=658196 RepID=A0A397SYF2_9GLOM|nr:Zn-finger in ubiquitin-hydrolases and other protein [Glomus cerebriforme]
MTYNNNNNNNNNNLEDTGKIIDKLGIGFNKLLKENQNLRQLIIKKNDEIKLLHKNYDDLKNSLIEKNNEITNYQVENLDLHIQIARFQQDNIGDSLLINDHSQQKVIENNYKMCDHVNNFVNLKKLEKKLQRKHLKFNCKTCVKNTETLLAITAEITPSLSSNDVTPKSQIYICLTCAKLHCGRYDKGHAFQHFEKKKHALVINLETFNIWCYECDDEIIPSTKYNQVVADAQTYIRKHLKVNEEEDIQGKFI